MSLEWFLECIVHAFNMIKMVSTVGESELYDG